MPNLEVRGSYIRETTNISDQRVPIVAEVAEVKIVSLKGSGAIQEKPNEIVERDEIVENDSDHWDLKDIMTAEEFKANALRWEMHILGETFCS